MEMLYCDEIEEVLGGDMILESNWKRRSETIFQDMAEIAQLIEQPKLVQFIEAAEEATFLLFPRRPEPRLAELTPATYRVLVDTVEYDANADSKDVERLQTVIDASHDNFHLLRPYYPTGPENITDRSIQETRRRCREFVEGKINVEEYLDWYFTWIDTELKVCESTGFYNQQVPMPRDVPTWAHQSHLFGQKDRLGGWVYYCRLQNFTTMAEVQAFASKYDVILKGKGSVSELLHELEQVTPPMKWRIPLDWVGDIVRKN